MPRAPMASPESAERPARRVLYLDDARVLATVAVVVLHTTAGWVDAAGRIPESVWWGANLVQSSVRFAVAVFVMISGALMLAPGPDPATAPFLARRFVRVGLPLLAWSLVYGVWTHLAFGAPFDAEVFARRMLAGSTHYHLYFLFAILGLYLWTPLLRRALARCSRREFAVLLLACWGLTFGYALHAEANGRMSDVTGSAFTKFLPFVGYYLLGHWLHSVAPQHFPKRWSASAFALALGTAAVGTGVLFDQATPPVSRRYLHSILSPTGFVLSVSVFVWLRALEPARLRLLRATAAYRHVRDGSLGIYLLHPLVLVYAQGLHAKAGLWLPAGLDLLVVAFAVTLVCTLVVSAIRALPGVRLMVG